MFSGKLHSQSRPLFQKILSGSRMSLENISYKHLFLRSLFSQISGLDYGLLTTCKSITTLAENTRIQFVVDESEWQEWIDICSVSVYVKKWSYQNDAGVVKISLNFKDSSWVEILLAYRIQAQDFEIASTASYLKNALINKDGVKVLSRADRFEYFFINSALDRKVFPASLGHHFLSTHPYEQRLILQHFSHKYKIEAPNLIRLINNISEYRYHLLRKLKNRPINTTFYPPTSSLNTQKKKESLKFGFWS